jgi:hypothetical protein
MNLTKLWNQLLGIATSFRRTGHTTLLQDLVKSDLVYVIVPDAETGQKLYGKNYYTFEQLRDLEMLPKSDHRPVMLDNFTLIRLSHMTYNELIEMQGQIRNRDIMIEKVKLLIELYQVHGYTPPPTNPNVSSRL